VPDTIRFHFDPLCPWAYQTSRWVHRLAELGTVEVTWGVFSLQLANEGDGRGPSEMALRTVVAVREAEGDDAVGRFYAALGRRVHQLGEAVDDEQVVVGALEDAGLNGVLADKAMGDEATWQTVVAEHAALVERTRSFGVPTIVLDAGEGPAIFGPVISEPPGDEDAAELWRHVSWLARYDNFSELKRDRTIEPDLESYRRFMAQARD
jgi:2-hydroxychromene-2-carboxylate isomerase